MIIVYPSALKHGLTEEEVISAWEHVFEYKMREGDHFPPHYLGLGVLPDERVVELVALSDGYDWYIFHAMCPPTRGFMHEYKGGSR